MIVKPFGAISNTYVDIAEQRVLEGRFGEILGAREFPLLSETIPADFYPCPKLTVVTLLDPRKSACQGRGGKSLPGQHFIRKGELIFCMTPTTPPQSRPPLPPDLELKSIIRTAFPRRPSTLAEH